MEEMEGKEKVLGQDSVWSGNHNIQVTQLADISSICDVIQVWSHFVDLLNFGIFRLRLEI